MKLLVTNYKNRTHKQICKKILLVNYNNNFIFCAYYFTFVEKNLNMLKSRDTKVVSNLSESVLKQQTGFMYIL